MTMAPLLKAKVRGGRLVLDEPTDLPDGTEVALVAVEDDELDDEERARLHAALDESERDVQAGRTRSASDVIADLRRAR
jgi:hypothetical protein